MEYRVSRGTGIPAGAASMGPRFGRVEYVANKKHVNKFAKASMGPRLGRVEYHNQLKVVQPTQLLQWGHA